MTPGLGSENLWYVTVAEWPGWIVYLGQRCHSQLGGRMMEGKRNNGHL